MIDRFTNQHRFLSNFYPAPVTLDGVLYPTVEHAYQAAKTINREERGLILHAAGPGAAKHLGKFVTLRPNWYEIRLVVMEDLVRQKFTNHQHLRDMLLSTGRY